MSFDRMQQQQQRRPEHLNEGAISDHASRRMSDEAHQKLDFHPRDERDRLQTDRQHDLRDNDFAPRRGGRAHDILHSASEGVGQKLWARTKFAGVVHGGNLGCAAAVSECLQRAGFSYANDAGVGGLVDQLTKKGWTRHPISEACAGDVVYGHKGSGWRNGGGNAHIGIMGDNGLAFANSSGSGKWKTGPLEGIVGARRFGQNRFCLRPPGGGNEFEGAPQRLEYPAERDNGPPDKQRAQREGQPTRNDGLDVIMDRSSSASEKLAVVQQLSHQGVSNFRFQGQDGQTYSMRTETESVGSREMVHLFITMPDGKERVVLRGIAQGDGSFTKEKSANGQSVDFYGKGADTNPSLYQRYRKEQERTEQGNETPGDAYKVPTSTSLSKILDDAQRAANNGVNQLIQTPQGVYMRARMDIDADGSPRARQIDPTGQTQTSMRYRDGSSVNAEVVPYMVLPGGQYSQFGIKLGDMCLVRNKENGKMTVAVFADVGPRHKRGEGSMALAEELGINSSPRHGGISKPNIEYLVLPGSGYPVQNQQQLMERIKAQRE